MLGDRHAAGRLALVALLLSCTEQLLTQSGRVAVELADLQVAPLTGMEASRPVLQGTRLCPTLRCAACGSTPIDVTSCFDSVVEGGSVDADGCVVADAVGPLAWHLQPRACDVAGYAPQAEELALQVVGPDAVHPVLSQWAEEWAEATLHGDFPPDWRDLSSGALRLAVGGTYAVDVELMSDAGPVAWNPSAASFTLTPGEGRAPVLVSGRDPGKASLTAPDVGAARLDLSIGESTWPLADVEAVAADEIDALTIVVGLSDGDGGTVPAGARALARTKDGHLVYGAPVRWSVTRGALIVTPTLGLPGQDYALLEDGCRGSLGRATLRATWDGLDASADLSWTGEGALADDQTACSAPPGCGCTSVSTSGWMASLAAAIVLLRRRSAAGAILALSACSPVTVSATRELGPLPWNPAVAGRDGGYSAATPSGSVWMFGDSIMRRPGEDGTTWRNNTWCVTTDDDASDGLSGFDEPVDALGVPREFLPMTDDERAFEAAHNGPDCGDDCAGIAMWPGAQVWDAEADRLIVFYALYELRPGFLNLTARGWSVALWPAGATAPERPLLRPDLADPTMLFGPGERWDPMASLIEGGWLYLVMCGGDLHACALGRARPADVTDPTAWTYWTGQSWSASWGRRATLVNAATIGSIHFNAYLGQYLMFYSASLGGGVVLRSAPELTGPWSPPTVIHQPLQPVERAWSYSALGHPEFAREGGRIEYLSYYMDWDGSMRLVEVEFP